MDSTKPELRAFRKFSSVKKQEKLNLPSKTLHRKPDDVEKVCPDGGWGWVVVCAGFIAISLSALPLITYGILFQNMFNTFKVSSANVAWIFNVHGFLWNLTIVLVGPLCDEFGERTVAIIGGILNFGSLILSAFAISAEYLYLTYSVLGGIGASTGNTVCLLVVTSYFEKRRGFAIGIMTIGMCIGSFISPLLVNFLVNNYGYKGAILICSALVLNQCACGMVYEPVELHMKKIPKESKYKSLNNESINTMLENQRKSVQFRRKSRAMSVVSAVAYDSFTPTFLNQARSSIIEYKPTTISEEVEEVPEITENFFKRIFKAIFKNLTSLKNLRVIIISISSGYLVLGYINFQMWIPFVVSYAGHSMDSAAWCLSAASSANLLGRICMTLLVDKTWFSIKYTYIFGIFVVGLSIFGFTLVQSLELLLTTASIWGLGVGIALSLHFTVMIEIMGPDLFPAVLGVSSLSIGLHAIIIGPIVGMIQDATGQYNYPLWMIGSLVLVGVVLWLLMPLAQAYDTKRLRKPNTEKQELSKY